MLKKIFVTVTAIAVVLPGAVLAQEGTDDALRPVPKRIEVNRPVPSGVRGEIRDIRQETKGAILDDRKELMDSRKDAQADLRDQAEAIRASDTTNQEKAAELKALREKFAADQKAAREAFEIKAKTARQEFEAKRKQVVADLKTRVAQFKDQQRAAVVTRVGENLNSLNAKLIGQMTEHVAKIEEVLMRVSNGADEAAASGVDVAAVRSVIDAAKTAIATARVAIAVQAAKTYSAPDLTEDNAKYALAAVRQTLKADLEAAQATVKAAAEAVRLAGKTLAGVQSSATNETSNDQ